MLLDTKTKWFENPAKLQISTLTLTETEYFKRSLFGKSKEELSNMLINRLKVAYMTIEKASILIAKGADVNTYNKRGDTPLSNAVNERDLPLAEFLLKNGANPNFTIGSADDDRPVLHKVANPWYKYASKRAFTEEQDLETAKLLLKYGADPNKTGMRNTTSNSVLQGPSKYGNVEMVKLLLENGADPNGSESDIKNGMTPLRFAIFSEFLAPDLHYFKMDPSAFHFRNPEIVKILLEAGANPKQQLGSNYTLIDFAKETKSTGFTATENGIEVKEQGVPVPPDPKIISLLEQYSIK